MLQSHDHGGVWGVIFDDWEVIVAFVGLFFTAFSIRAEAKARRIGNLVELTRSHRELWTAIDRDPRLSRLTDPEADLQKQPITPEEELYANFVILHTNAAFHALRDHLTVRPEGLEKDVRQFFSLPIPRAVWERVKGLQNRRFREFVDRCRSEKLICESPVSKSP